MHFWGVAPVGGLYKSILMIIVSISFSCGRRSEEHKSRGVSLNFGRFIETDCMLSNLKIPL